MGTLSRSNAAGKTTMKGAEGRWDERKWGTDRYRENVKFSVRKIELLMGSRTLGCGTKPFRLVNYVYAGTYFCHLENSTGNLLSMFKLLTHRIQIIAIFNLSELINIYSDGCPWLEFTLRMVFVCFFFFFNAFFFN